MQSLLFSFQGRVNRAKFWLVHIAMWVVVAVVFGVVLGGAAMSSDPTAAAAALASVGVVGGLVLLVVYILMVWISLAIAAKRWHDRNKSAWWILIAFVPVVGVFWYLIECGFLRGTSGANKYGADPLGSVRSLIADR
jgi:uncharacterized membrane protein YhaH (DUF805 family)